MDQLFSQKHLPRSVAVCGWKLRAHRVRRGWTQIELATRAGYCERLVRKAELSGSVARETLEVLAMTLSDAQLAVHPGDLIDNSKSEPLGQCLLFGTDSKDFLELTDPLIEVDCSRVDNRIPLWGRFSGHRNSLRWYCTLLTLIGSERIWLGLPVAIESLDHGFLHVDGIHLVDNQQKIKFDIDLRYSIENGKISRIVWLSSLAPLANYDSIWKFESFNSVGPLG